MPPIEHYGTRAMVSPMGPEDPCGMDVSHFGGVRARAWRDVEGCEPPLRFRIPDENVVPREPQRLPGTLSQVQLVRQQADYGNP